MYICVGYERKDFFGGRGYAEDATVNGTTADLIRALKALKAGKIEALKTENTSYYYDTAAERENDIITACQSEIWNSRDFYKISYTALLKKFKRA